MTEGPIQKILDKTNNGLDIILSLVPEAANCIGNKRHFKIVEEKTPSAILSKLDNGIYWVKCYSSGFSGNALNLFSYLEGKDFKDTLKILGDRYGAFNDSAPPPELRPKITKRPAHETEIIGQYTFDIKDKPSESDLLSVFSKNTVSFAAAQNKKDHSKWDLPLIAAMNALGWSALNSFTYVTKKPEGIIATTTESTPEYPIFIIRGKGFEKIYQPLSRDKAFRFRYNGEKPMDYIFGYERFCNDFAEYEKKEIERAVESKENESKGKKSREIKLDNVIICSGDADALNVKVFGYHVIWLNAEGSKIPHTTFTSLKKKADNVYNLPDIDDTGIKEDHKKGLMHFELKHIYLPADLRLKNDHRGNPCKDVRDFFNHFSKFEFDKLVKSALEYKFWDEEINYDRDGNAKGTVYVYNDVRALNFLSKCGFHRLRSKTAKVGYDFIKIDGNVVRKVDAREVKRFIVDYLREHYSDNQKLRNTMIRSARLKDEALENLDYIDLNFKTFEENKQFFFFKNKTWEVTPEKIQEYSNKTINRYVWEDKVIPRDVKVMSEPPFTITRIERADKTYEFKLTIHNYNCLFLRYLINVSRVYWRTELEDRCEEKYRTEEERSAYREKYKFRLDGELLSASEIKEQEDHFINKVFLIGYCLCLHKKDDQAWAPFIMDHVLSKEGESRGGSGKSLLLRSLTFLLKTVFIDGKSKSLTDDKFAFENVDESIEFVRVEDLARYVDMEPFYNMVTGDFWVNPKNATRFSIPYERSPRIAFTTNYGLRGGGPSSSRRLLYAACSDYYHNNDNGFYRENRTVADDFGKRQLFQDFTPEEWNLFFNTQINCLKTFYNIPDKVNPPMDNVMKRNLMAIMGDAFFNWADVYFSAESGNIDTMVIRQEAFDDFVRNNNIPKAYGMQKFSASVEAWCNYYRFEFNPVLLRNTQGRIIIKAVRKDSSGRPIKTFTVKNGVMSEKIDKVSTEMLYIKTTTEKLDDETIKRLKSGDDGYQTITAEITTRNDEDTLPF